MMTSQIQSSRHRKSIEKIGVTKIRTANIENVVGIKKNKLERLGSGSYATVYSKPKSNTVIKVGSDNEDGWIRYAAELVKNKKKFAKNPYLPKIKSLKFYYNEKKDFFFYVAKIEKLKDLDTATDRAYDVTKVLEHMMDNCGISARNMLPIDDKLKEAMNFILSLGLDTDIHSGNVMIRGKKQLVFTDPVQ